MTHKPDICKTEAIDSAFNKALEKLGEPEDEFNKYHLDEGELRAFFYEGVKVIKHNRSI